MLSFKQGDPIIIYQKNESGWGYGELNGTWGWVPYNYLAPTNDTTSPQTPSSAPTLRHRSATSQMTSSTPASPDHYQTAIHQASEHAKHQFLGQLEREYQALFLKYQSMGKSEFEAQYQTQQQRLSKYLYQLTQQLDGQVQTQQHQFQTSLETLLQNKYQQSFSQLSDPMRSQLQTQLQNSLGDNFQQNIHDILSSQAYQHEIQRLQEGLLQKITERQQQIALEMVYVQTEQKQLQNEHAPLYQEYQHRQQTLAEQHALQQPDAVRVFYNTIEKSLGSKLISAMSLASGIIKREASKTENRVDMATKVAGKLCEFVPLVGGVASTVVEMSGKAYGYYQNRQHKKAHSQTLDSVIRLEDAMQLAELVARRVAQSYRRYIVDTCLSVQAAEAAADNVANIVYTSIQHGELKSTHLKTLEQKIDYLVKQVHAQAKQQTGKFFKKTTVFNKPVAMQLSKADKKHLQNVAKNVDSFKAQNELKSKHDAMEIARLKAEAAQRDKEIQAMQQQLSQFQNTQKHALFTPQPQPSSYEILQQTQWPEVIRQLQPQLPEGFSCSLQRDGKKITLQSNTSEHALSSVGELLHTLFKNDIDDVDVENQTLLLVSKTSIKARKLESFLQQLVSPNCDATAPTLTLF